MIRRLRKKMQIIRGTTPSCATNILKFNTPEMNHKGEKGEQNPIP